MATANNAAHLPTAAENLLPYSKQQPAIFKVGQLTPVKDLKLLVRDYPPIAKNALTILINISTDIEVLKLLAQDDAFLETLLARVTNPKEPNADALSILLANIAKSPSIARLIRLNRERIPDLSPSPLAITQLLELFNRGGSSSYNADATYDYLAYVFADLAKETAFITYLTTPPPHTLLTPLTTFLPLTTHPSPPRRLGTALLLKNTALLLPTPSIPSLLPSVLHPLLLPLSSPHQPNITEQEMDLLPPECQYLGSEHVQESDVGIIGLHLETLYLLATRGGVEGRRGVRSGGTYAVVRELHLGVEDEAVRRGCERLVDVLMGEELEGDIGDGGKGGRVGGDEGKGGGRMVTQADVGEEDEEEDEIVPIF